MRYRICEVELGFKKTLEVIDFKSKEEILSWMAERGYAGEEDPDFPGFFDLYTTRDKFLRVFSLEPF